MSQPKISVVTPSFNQATFIEQTLRSVLEQQYPNLEYIVIDGGSTDGTLDILRQYENRLAYWVSEPDLGQADAINKGFTMASGDICSYVNSDDLYKQGCLWRVATDFSGDAGREWHAYPVQDFADGALLELHDTPRFSRALGKMSAGDRERTANHLMYWVVGRVGLHQPGVFWRRDQWKEVQGFDVRYHYAFDRQFFMKLVLAGYPLITHGGQPVAHFRLHDSSKTVRMLRGTDNVFARERSKIADEFEMKLDVEERRIARRLRLQDSISTAWRMSRNGASRGDCFAWLLRLALKRRGALTSRYFWGSALRFLFARPAGGS